MEFFIKSGANLPALKMQVISDGRSDFKSVIESLEQAKVFLSMVDITTGINKIALAPCDIITETNPDGTLNYFIYYKFTSKNTNKPGRYKVEFFIQNAEGNLNLPIKDTLFVNVQESFVSIANCCPDNTRIRIRLSAYISSGSINILYVLESNKELPFGFTLNFTNTYDVFVGSPIVVSTGVTINSNTKYGETNVYLSSDDFNNLQGVGVFSNISFNPSYISNIFDLTEQSFFVTATPTPTPSITPTLTSTPTPTPTQTEEVITDAILTTDIGLISVGLGFYLKFVDFVPEQIITDAILTNDGEYILVGTDMYLSFINPTPNPTPTPTPTPTNTPTNTSTNIPINTPTPTQTEQVIIDAILTNDGNYIQVGNEMYLKYINPTPPPTPTNTPTNTQTPTNTPTPSITPTFTPTNTKTPTPTPTIASLVTDGLVLYYDFSNPVSYSGSGVNIIDLSPSNNNGIVVNDYGHISYVSSGSTSYFNWSSNAGGSGGNSFGGSIHTNSANTYQDFTMVFQPDFLLGGMAGLFSIPNDKSLRVYSNGWVFPNPGNNDDWASSSATNFYINGQVSNQAVSGWNIMGGATTNSNFAGPTQLYVGTSGYQDRNMQGKIAVVLMYNRVLTGQEQIQNYNFLKTRFGL